MALAAALEPIQKDIADLRRAQYEAQGQKTSVVETSTSARSTVAIAVAMTSVLVALLSIVAAIVIASV